MVAILGMVKIQDEMKEFPLETWEVSRSGDDKCGIVGRGLRFCRENSRWVTILDKISVLLVSLVVSMSKSLYQSIYFYLVPFAPFALIVGVDILKREVPTPPAGFDVYNVKFN